MFRRELSKEVTSGPITEWWEGMTEKLGGKYSRQSEGWGVKVEWKLGTFKEQKETM